ncbi:MAG: GntR family transcriptional regulator [Clostridia bacterium]|nr:GntR family transcriptional regulator [Clostridia bacterium]
MLYINKYSPTPIYLQIIEQFEQLIFSDVLSGEDQLPSVRTLAKELGVNPNTLQRAYNEMENMKLCISVPGSGRYVSKGAKKILSEKKQASLKGIREIIKDAKLSGSTLDDIIKIVKKAYEEA